MSKLELCIFDMDGLLIDTEKRMWTTNGFKACVQMGVEPNLEFSRSLMGISVWKTEQMFKEHFGPDFDTKKYNEIVLSLNEKQIESGDIPLMPGARELLEFLKEKNIKRTIATSTKRETAEKILNKLDLAKYFDIITCGDEVSNSKPAPDIYLKALEKFNVDKEKAFVFEDANNGGLAALAAGIPLILVPDIAPLTDEVKEKAYRVIPSLNNAIELIKDVL